MIAVVVEFHCDWDGCGATKPHVFELAPWSTLTQPSAPSEWVRVDDRLYCDRHQVFIRERDEDAAWSGARWVEERTPRED